MEQKYKNFLNSQIVKTSNPEIFVKMIMRSNEGYWVCICIEQSDEELCITIAKAVEFNGTVRVTRNDSSVVDIIDEIAPTEIINRYESFRLKRAKRLDISSLVNYGVMLEDLLNKHIEVVNGDGKTIIIGVHANNEGDIFPILTYRYGMCLWEGASGLAGILKEAQSVKIIETVDVIPELSESLDYTDSPNAPKLTVNCNSVELNDQRGVFAKTHLGHIVFITDSNEVIQIPEDTMQTLKCIFSLF